MYRWRITDQFNVTKIPLPVFVIVRYRGTVEERDNEQCATY